MSVENVASAVTEAGADVLKQSLATMLQKATEGVEAGVGFLSAQIPDVVHQLLLYKLVQCFADVVLIALGWVALVLGYKFFSKKSAGWEPDHFADENGWRMGKVATICLAAVYAIFSFFVIADIVSTAIKIWLAPKIYLIQYAAELLK